MGCGDSRPVRGEVAPVRQDQAPRPVESRRGESSSAGQTRVEILRQQADIIAKAAAADAERERAKSAPSDTSKGDSSTIRLGTSRGKGKGKVEERVQLTTFPSQRKDKADLARERRTKEDEILRDYPESKEAEAIIERREHRREVGQQTFDAYQENIEFERKKEASWASPESKAYRRENRERQRKLDNALLRAMKDPNWASLDGAPKNEEERDIVLSIAGSYDYPYSSTKYQQNNAERYEKLDRWTTNFAQPYDKQQKLDNALLRVMKDPNWTSSDGAPKTKEERDIVLSIAGSYDYPYSSTEYQQNNGGRYQELCRWTADFKQLYDKQQKLDNALLRAAKDPNRTSSDRAPENREERRIALSIAGSYDYSYSSTEYQQNNEERYQELCRWTADFKRQYENS